VRLSKLIELIELIWSGGVSWLLFEEFRSEDFFVGGNFEIINAGGQLAVCNWQLAIDSRKYFFAEDVED
jgi:hypothetical protein